MVNKIIGYTTGVFDLFHVGHLNILKRASEQCDYLIVGITDCPVVENYKGYRPIVPLEERMEIVIALRFVDAVVVQKSMDKLAMWKKLKYNLMFHGDDWKGSDMYLRTEKELTELGVEVVYFPYTQGTSTTELKRRIYNEFANS